MLQSKEFLLLINNLAVKYITELLRINRKVNTRRLKFHQQG